MTGFSTLKMVAKCKKQSNGNSILQYVSKKKKKHNKKSNNSNNKNKIKKEPKATVKVKMVKKLCA